MIISGCPQLTHQFIVFVTQHEVGSFNVCMDIFILMNILQYIDLAQTQKTRVANMMSRL